MIDLFSLVRYHSESISLMWLIDILVFLALRPRLARNIWIMFAENVILVVLFHHATAMLDLHGESLTPAMLALVVSLKAGICSVSLMLQWAYGKNHRRKYQNRSAYLDAATLCLRLAGVMLIYWDLRYTAGHSYMFDSIIYTGFLYLVVADLIVWAGYDERAEKDPHHQLRARERNKPEHQEKK